MFRFTQPGDIIAPAAATTPATPQYNTTGVPAAGGPGQILSGDFADTARRLKDPNSLNSALANAPGFGPIFSRIGSKPGAPREGGGGNQSQPGYSRLDQPARSALLQSMLSRARGGQPGGAPTAPLPTSPANIAATSNPIPGATY